MQGRPANFPKKFDNAGANFSDFMGTKSQQDQFTKTTLTEYKPKVKSSGLTGLGSLPAKVTQTKLSPITGDGGGISKITAPKGPVTQTQTGNQKWFIY